MNQSNAAIKNIVSLSNSGGKEEKVQLMVQQVHDLAWLQQGNFTPEKMQAFIDRTSALLGTIDNNEPLDMSFAKMAPNSSTTSATSTTSTTSGASETPADA